MKYQSTRGHQKILTFEQAVLQGLGPDGGLYIPTEIPHFSEQVISTWKDLSFAQVAFNVCRNFISSTEIADETLKELCTKSFSTFSHPKVTPVNKLPVGMEIAPNKNFDNLWILELFHGPTFAFKDVALQFLGNLFEYFLEKKNSEKSPQDKEAFITVIGATSGDTGGAAIYGLQGKKNIDIFILHPHKRISRVQEQQMTTVLTSNVYNIALEGSFDDCQDIVKELFADKDFKEKYQVGAINSINWARILVQAELGSNAKIQFSVPSGNFGDVLAGFYAKKMGLPIHRLIVATNENDILDRFFKTGTYDKKIHSKEDPVKQTYSPAMDILISSNFERLLWYLVKEDSTECSAEGASLKIKEYMNTLKTQGGFSVSNSILQRARSLFTSHRVDDATTKECISRYFHQKVNPVILDPHTAVGIEAAEHVLLRDNVTDVVQTICLATASPGKFPEIVLSAINESPCVKKGSDFVPITEADFSPKALLKLNGLPQRMTVVKTNGEKEKCLELVRHVVAQTLVQSA